MGLWPFRRRSNRRASPNALRREENIHDARTRSSRARDGELDTTSPGPGRRRSRADSSTRRRASRESKRLEKRRAYSFASGQNDSIAIRRDANAPPVPPLPPHLAGHGTPTPGKSIRSYTQPPDGGQDWQRVPTLHKRSAQEMSRRKSSKKRKEEHTTREAEIKAMSTSMPTRPATELGLSGRPMKKESKRMRGGPNNPSSDISLPTAESIRSSFSSDADPPAAYKVSAFYILSPRPTIRYSQNPHYASGASLTSDNPESQKRRVSDRVRLSDDILKANKRVDDLADDLSAGELRELMDRDQKRKERKKNADQIKIQKKLAHRQEQQREAEANAERAGSPPPANMERGVLGRDVVGADAGTSAVVTSTKRKGSVGSETGRGKRPAEAFKPDNSTNTQSSVDASLTTDTTAPTSVQPITDANLEASTTAGPLPLPQGAETRTRREVSASQKSELSVSEVPTPSAATVPPVLVSPAQPKRRSSEASTRPPQSWTSFFKRSPKQKPALVPPPSFSNTSRDSMQTNQTTQAAYTPPKPAASVPKRTMSKFREDLPELPLSPPYSRVQSPEADIIPPIRKEFIDKRSSTQAVPEEPHVRYDTPTSGHRSFDITQLRNETPNSGDRSVDVPSPDAAALLSQSLASIDSEGSWLSGRKNSKRGSTQLSSRPLQDSASSLHKRYRDFTESTEELGIAEDEYFSRLTPGYEDYKSKRQSTGNPMASSDEEDGGSIAGPGERGKTTWGAVGRRPTVIHHQPRAKSREGLLNEFEYDSGSEGHIEQQVEIDRVSKDSDESDIRIHRATSVDLGSKHARHISAGSARLLELKGRASGDSKRLSLNSDLG